MAVALMGHVINKLRFLSDFKANIMQEKDQKSFFDLYSGSKEIDLNELPEVLFRPKNDAI